MSNDMKHVEKFVQIANKIADAIEHREAPDELLAEAYELAGVIRDMSDDPKWKAPCNAVRESFRKPREEQLRVIMSLVWLLPNDAKLNELDYIPESVTEVARLRDKVAQLEEEVEKLRAELG